MKTMEKLCRRFEKMFPGYAADLDDVNSYRGYYRVCIIDLEHMVFSYHCFTSCDDFRLMKAGKSPFPFPGKLSSRFIDYKGGCKQCALSQ